MILYKFYLNMNLALTCLQSFGHLECSRVYFVELYAIFQELDLVESSSTVYKMIGPVLVKQDVEEARQNVQKRIDYINGEM